MPLHPHHWLDYRHWLNWTWWDLRLFDLNWCGAQGLHWGHHSLLRDQFVGRYRAMVDHLLRRLEIGAHRCGWKHSHGSQLKIVALKSLSLYKQFVCTKTGSWKLLLWARLTSLLRNFAKKKQTTLHMRLHAPHFVSEIRPHKTTTKAWICALYFMGLLPNAKQLR